MSTSIELTQPLSGIRVLVGRARRQAGALSSELRKLGADVIEVPFIEIRKPRSFKPLDSALTNLHAYDWLILTSVNGVEAMWERIGKLRPRRKELIRVFARSGKQGKHGQEEQEFARTTKIAETKPGLAAQGHRLRIAAIGPATKKAIERRGVKVDVVPEEYVAESVVRSLQSEVKGKRILLVRAKVARDVIPLELRKAGAQVDVVEAYETVVPHSSRVRLRSVLKDSRRRPDIITFTSSSTVRNFAELLGSGPTARAAPAIRGRRRPLRVELAGIRLASIGPVTSSTLRELGLPVDIEANEFTIPGLVRAITRMIERTRQK